MSVFCVFAAAREAPRAVALRTPDAAWTYAELAARAAPAVAALRGAGGPERVLLTPRVDPDALVPLYAALALGRPVALLHPRLTPPERAALAARCAPALDGDALFGGLGAVPCPVPGGGDAAAPPEPAPADDERPLAIVFTSGSSGAPKGVVLSRAAFAASAAASAARLGWRADDAWLLALPPAHVGGLSVVTRCLAARRTVVLEPGHGSAALARGVAAATLASLVPLQLHRLLDERPAWRPPARLRAVLLGGAGAAPALVAAARRRGLPVRETYGLTEACSQVATQEPDDPPGHATPLPGCEVRVVDGVLELRAPTLMSGYLPPGGEPWTADGWLRTGDRGALDGRGRVRVFGRADDVIVTAGENVDPREVELALVEDPAVAAALVFGVADAARGEAVAALLVARPGVIADPARVAAGLAGRLAAFKRPRLYAVVPELPVTPSGKPDRRAARTVPGLQEYPRPSAGPDRRQENP